MLAESSVLIISQYMWNQPIMLYALNLYSGVFQLFLNKLEIKRGDPKSLTHSFPTQSPGDFLDLSDGDTDAHNAGD